MFTRSFSLPSHYFDLALGGLVCLCLKRGHSWSDPTRTNWWAQCNDFRYFFSPFGIAVETAFVHVKRRRCLCHSYVQWHYHPRHETHGRHTFVFRDVEGESNLSRSRSVEGHLFDVAKAHTNLRLVKTILCNRMVTRTCKRVV